jgi:neutral ceramidase
MRHTTILSCVLSAVMVIAALAMLAGSAVAQNAPLSVGLAEIEITPPLGYRMDGYFTERLSTGTKDPLKARALVFQQGATKMALVVADLLGLPQALTTEVRTLAAQKTGIPVTNIAITATHTHTGPMFSGPRARLFSERAAAKFGTDPLASVKYPEMLRDRLVEVMVAATAGLSPAALEFVRATEDRVSFNRRFHMKDGTVRFNPGVLNPDIVRAAGPTDPDLPFVLITKDGKAVGSLTVFALHLDTVGGTEYAADYPGHLEHELRREFGERFISVFGLGTCGDINHLDVSGRRRLQSRLIGQQLAVDVLSARLRTPLATPSLGAVSARVTLPLRKVSDAQVAAARSGMSKVGTSAVPFLTQVDIVTTLDLASRGPSLDAEVQVFRLHPDLAIVLLPGEVFVDLGLAIKQASPFAHTLVIELSNDNPAYIPTEKAFKEGSYETVNSRIAPGGGERLVTEAVRLLKEMTVR